MLLPDNIDLFPIDIFHPIFRNRREKYALGTAHYSSVRGAAKKCVCVCVCVCGGGGVM